MSYIRSVEVALPPHAVDSAALADIFGVDEEWIDMFVGTKTRYLGFDFDTWEPTVQLEDLAVEAASAALQNAGVGIEQIDTIVLATATPDRLMPATVNMLADRLGANEVSTYQVQSGCVGALQAINLARQLLRSGEVGTCLVVGGDVCGKFMPDRDKCRDLGAMEMVNYMLFGDGAGALVLSRDPVPGAVEIVSGGVRFVGRGRAPGQSVAWLGADAARRGTSGLLQEDYKAIGDHVPKMTAEVMQASLAAQGVGADGVDHYLLPQLSTRMSDKIAADLGVAPERAIHVVERIGNNGNALAFFQLAELFARAAPGETALAIAIESSKWLTGNLFLRRCDA